MSSETFDHDVPQKDGQSPRTFHGRGKLIQKVRESKEISIKQAAARCKISRRTYQLIERNERDPFESTLKKIADGLGIDYKLLEIGDPRDLIDKAMEFRGPGMFDKAHDLVAPSYGPTFKMCIEIPISVPVDPDLAKSIVNIINIVQNALQEAGLGTFVGVRRGSVLLFFAVKALAAYAYAEAPQLDKLSVFFPPISDQERAMLTELLSNGPASDLAIAEAVHRLLLTN